MAIATLSVRMQAEPVRSLDYSSISGTYMGIGTGIDHPARMIMVQNLTDANLMFSLDGINDHFPLPFSGLFILDVATNMSVSQGFFLGQGERLYVKEIGTPSTGSVYFSVFYGTNS